ncbi:MAG: hypothetical protein ACXACE_14495 [Candidatus Thorarchaeota archaeon]
MEKNVEQPHKHNQQDVNIIIAVLILFSPWGMMVMQDSTGVYWLLWSIILRPSNSYFSIHLSPDPILISIIVLRVIFGILVIRIYSERSTMKRILSVGILAEYSIVFLALLQSSLVLLRPDWPYVMIGIPTPLLLLCTLYLLKRYPPPTYDDSWLFKQKKVGLESISPPNPD